MKDTYNYEKEFEQDLIALLKEKGWRDGVLKYKTEEELINNWADKLYNNNRDTDRLGNYPLTRTEMEQIISQINKLKAPFYLNGFINGGHISIKRDNPNDKAHLGKDVYLRIYDKKEIAGGKSTYQIAEQPKFSKKSQYLSDRRGDFMLLINGMPVIHIELKRSGIPVSQAENQIQKYSEEGLFTGLFSLIQIFVAMTPDETTYFANPGTGGKFNKKFYFHWQDFNNEIINDWKMIADQFLSIPMAHQLIGYYTVADKTDNTLKVLRSYQYYAANKISRIVSKTPQNERESKKDLKGGYVWHTTGSGKTLTSFKAAQLIAASGDADKVVFLMDRVELGTQSYEVYKNFAFIGNDEVQDTENTDALRARLKSNNKNDTLIVTSIQKMSRLKDDDPSIKDDLEKIRKKRLVIIVDECHRSVFGDMLGNIKAAFPNALKFGFTGTPIHEENKKKGNTTSDIFGDELHRYSISDAIRDKNVLGFDTFKIETFDYKEIRKKVALEKSKSKTEEEALNENNKIKKKIYLKYMNDIPMASLNDECIENFIPSSQYRDDKHWKKVCEHILKNWITTSINYKYHAILASSSISEACAYYRLLKELINDPKNGYPVLNITALFDPSTDNDGNDKLKDEYLEEILSDYNKMFGHCYSVSDYQYFKKDVANRLAHKNSYRSIKHEDRLDLLIVVKQMLTGFDSKWINTLYLDQYIEFENIVQAFSRTNRLCDSDKPNGLIYYYRKPNLMELNIAEAFDKYSGSKPFGIFVDKLDKNLDTINDLYDSIAEIFRKNGIDNFSSVPQNETDASKFVIDFNKLSSTIESAKVQGFRWTTRTYEFIDDKGRKTTKELRFNEFEFEIIRNRYKELYDAVVKSNTTKTVQIPPYDVDPSLIEMASHKINYEYMEKNFKKYIKEIPIYGPDGDKAIEVLKELRRSFSYLSQDEQKIANLLVNEIQSGDRIVKEGDTLNDLINQYKITKRDKSITSFCKTYLIPENKFIKFVKECTTHSNINQYGALDKLIDSCDIRTLASKLNKTPFQTRVDLTSLVKNFIFSDCMEFDE